MEIVWDEWKRKANLLKHGLDFAVLDLEVFARACIGQAKRGRLLAVGEIDGIVTVIFVRLGAEGISVVSMRPAHQKEGRLLDA